MKKPITIGEATANYIRDLFLQYAWQEWKANHPRAPRKRKKPKKPKVKRETP